MLRSFAPPTSYHLPAFTMAKHLERQIEILKQKILFVGTLVEEAIAKAISALVNRDRNLAKQVIDEDAETDRMEVEVEEEVLKILALYQPVAADLRFVVAVLKINNDLERMGDLAKNIAKRVVFLTNGEKIELPHDLRPMANKAQQMVKESLDALVNADTLLARRVRDADDEVDSMRRTVQEFVEQKIAEHPEHTELLMRLLSVSRHLERLADLATNVAEDVIYMVEGEIVRHRATEPM
jgi:phosphate transport system protein